MKEYTNTYYLSAGEGNPENELPWPLLVQRIIEVATAHANAWGMGHDTLIRDHHSWVLSRLTVEVQRMPRVDERYSLTTWIEDYNSAFSQRNIELYDGNGVTIGYARTIWMVIDMRTRKRADITQLSYMSHLVSTRPCPIDPPTRLRAVECGTCTHRWSVGYTDCDANRHVNTVRYLEHVMNCFTLERYERQVVTRLELAFLKETHYGATLQLTLDDTDPNDCRLAISQDGADHVRVRLCWRNRLQGKPPS